MVNTSLTSFGQYGTLNGGKGSGNFGHGGRHGKVGGSSKRTGGADSSDNRRGAERQFKDKEMVHRDLSYLVRANRKGEHVSLDTIMQEKSVQEAEKRSKFDKSTLEEYENDPKRQKLQEELTNRLLDDKTNGAFTQKEGDKKGTLSGEVAQDKEAFIVIGRPAGGKSSVFANPLSRDNKARIIDSDMVKEWLPEFDNGFGAGRVQRESDMIMQKALNKATDKGENVVIPKIGGKSVLTIAKQLKDKGYKVHLSYNEVSAETSIARAMSRFAETGRYLSPQYLQSIGSKPADTFKQYATEKSLFDSAEWKNNDVKFGQKPKTVWTDADGKDKLKNL